MSDPYIGEIRMFGGNFAPIGWMFCNGQLLSISAYEALFNLIGTTYGGDGQTTFALPDLQGRLPIHQSPSHVLGQAAGTEFVTLTSSQLPAHDHAVRASSAEAETANPTGAAFASNPDTPFYGAANPGKAANLSGAVVAASGGGQPHGNIQPYLCVSFIIAVEGIYPQQG